MPDGNAKIIVGTSPVAADRRHAYLLFEHSDGRQFVVRGGPDANPEGSAIGNLAGSTLLGSDNYGNIRVDAGPYVPPYQAVYQKQADGSLQPIPREGANLEDARLVKGADGEPLVRTETAPDWPRPNETHEHRTVWQGTDAQLEQKLQAALKAGQQINDAQLEYSPLANNSNGVASTLLKAADVTPALPLGKDGKPVTAPNFGENLYQDVGIGSYRSGYWFDGKQWHDNDDHKIQPPKSGEATVPLDPDEKSRSGSGSFHSSIDPPRDAQPTQTAFSTGDPELDKLAAATFANDEAGLSQAAAQIAQSQQVQALAAEGHRQLANQQQEQARQPQAPAMGA